MTRANSAMIALALAIFVSASATMPSVAAPISNAAALRAAAPDDLTQVRQRRRESNRAHRHRPFFGTHGTAAGSYAQTPGRSVHAAGSWHVNANGLPYRVPEDCAYPIGYSSSGAAIFQTFGCHLP
jgi:hypothetical protein